MNYWLVKQEPQDYSWADFTTEKRTAWTGVRNFQARNNLRSMKKGDRVLFYHSGSGKEVVGVARVAKEAYPDPTAEDEAWCCVDLMPIRPLRVPVSLAAIKHDKALKDIALVRQTRLSVMPITSAEFNRVLKLGETR